MHSTSMYTHTSHKDQQGPYPHVTPVCPLGEGGIRIIEEDQNLAVPIIFVLRITADTDDPGESRDSPICKCKTVGDPLTELMVFGVSQ